MEGAWDARAHWPHVNESFWSVTHSFDGNGEYVLLWRDGGDVSMSAVDPATFRCIETLAAGRDLASAYVVATDVDSAFDLEPYLRDLLAHGLGFYRRGELDMKPFLAYAADHYNRLVRALSALVPVVLLLFRVWSGRVWLAVISMITRSGQCCCSPSLHGVRGLCQSTGCLCASGRTPFASSEFLIRAEFQPA